MTQNLENIDHRRPDRPGQPPQGGGRRSSTPPPRGPWYRSPWVAAVAALVVVNLLYALPRYLPMDPSRSRVPIDPKSPEQFPMIIAHLLTGNIAMVTVFLQVLPWLRRAYPNVHRMSGYVYVFGGVLPSAGLGLILLPYQVIPSGRLGLAVEAILWIAVTLQGFRMQQQHRYAEHRRWMTYSFALALGTTWSRVLFYAMMWIPGFTLGELVFLEITSWLGWVTNLVVAFVWLEWTDRGARPRNRIQVSSERA